MKKYDKELHTRLASARNRAREIEDDKLSFILDTLSLNYMECASFEGWENHALREATKRKNHIMKSLLGSDKFD